MKTARDYPVKYVFGFSKAYGSTFHTGEDRSTPMGTPVKVNNTVIGYTGDTGKVTGPHIHVTRQRLYIPINPKGSGFKLSTSHTIKPKVIFAGTSLLHPANGKYIKIRNWQGDEFVYCHLSKITCKKGDYIK
jgi:hypothetical protein